MKKVVSFFVITGLFLTFILPVSAQRQINNKLNRNAATEFASAEAFSDGNGVWFKWQMKAEVNNLGFNVYRIKGDLKEQVNRNLISGGFLANNEETVLNGTYKFFDPTGKYVDTYLIETMTIDGQNVSSQYVTVKYVNNLFELAGISSADLVRESQNDNSVIEKSEITLSKELQTEISENALPPNIDRQRQIAAQTGLRLGVKKEGIYRVSRTELSNAGFDVNQPSSNWQLFMNGNEQAIIVGANGSYIEFYGQPIDTIESGTQIYFLINGAQAGKRIASSVRRRLGGSVVANSYEQSFYKADRVIYLSSVRNGDANNFFSSSIVNTTGVTVSFNLDGIDRTFTSSYLTLGIQGLTTAPHNTEVSINGTALEPISGNNLELMMRTYQIPTSVLLEGANSIFLKVPSSGSDVSLVESIRVGYSRKYLAKQNTLSAYAKGLKQSEIKGFTNNNIRVFDTTYSDEPRVISNLQQTQENGTFGVIIPPSRAAKIFATTDDAVLAVDSIELNTPSTLTTVNHNAELIIITHKNWMNEAQNWATYRRNQGTSVEVVRVDDIFDEFNYGILNSGAIRSFLQYAKNNWQTAPNYVLILGDASWDPRNYTTSPNVNFVPTKFFDTAYEETGSDEALADFNDDGLAELAVGRIPAKTPADVTQMLNKVTTFEATAGQGFSRGALFASDLPNGYDFAGMNQRLANQLPTGTSSMMINRGDANARVNLLTALNTGKYLVNYSGHGSPTLWAAAEFYSAPDVPTISNGTNYSIFTMLTCLNGYFISPTNESLAELMLSAPNGGGVSAWASSGKTTPDVQEILARRFYQKISEGNILRMGDLVNDAKQNVIGGRDVRLSWTLLGDPMTKVH